MTRRWLTSAADRVFGTILRLMLRRAIVPMMWLDDRVLSEAGLSRNAIAAFLATPLGTDPAAFFARFDSAEHAQRCQTGKDAVCRGPAWPPIVRPSRLMAAGAVVAMGSLGACLATSPNGAATIRRDDPPARCRIRPDGPPPQSIIPAAATIVMPPACAQFTGAGRLRLTAQRDARAGPARAPLT